MGNSAKPNEIKKLQGNPGRRPIKKSVKSQAVKSKPAPVHLDLIAKNEWKRILKTFVNIELITEADLKMLEAYCIMYSKWRQASKEAKLDKKNFNQLSSYYNLELKYLKELKGLAVEFGFTPSSRAKLGIIDNSDKNDPAQDFLNRKFKVIGGKNKSNC